MSNAPRSRDEIILRRQVLLALGAMPDVLVMVNEANAVTKLSRLIEDKKAAAQAVLPEERFGLGRGSPDLVVGVRGRVLFRELKTEDGRLSPEQIEWHAQARMRGLDVEVWRSVEEALADVERARTAGRFVRGVYRAACAECHDTGVDASTGEGCGCKKKGRRA